MIAGSAGRRFLWLTVALSYYAISFNAGNLSDNVYLSFALVSLPLFPSGYASRLMMDHPRLGRRLTNTTLLSLLVPVIAVGALFESTATPARRVTRASCLLAGSHASRLFPLMHACALFWPRPRCSAPA